MTIAYRIEDGVAFVAWSGQVTAAELAAHLPRLISDPAWPPRRRLHLTDMRFATADASLDRAAMEGVLRLAESVRGRASGMRIAFVAHTIFDAVSPFQQLAAQADMSVIVFVDLNTACTWLGVDPQTARRVLDELRAQAPPPGQ